MKKEKTMKDKVFICNLAEFKKMDFNSVTQNPFKVKLTGNVKESDIDVLLNKIIDKDSDFDLSEVSKYSEYDRIVSYENGLTFYIKNGVLLHYEFVDECDFVEIPEGITEIADSCFEFNWGEVNMDFDEVSLPSTLKKIGNSAFRCCTDLNKINFTEGLEEIGDEAFCGCSNLYKES